MYASSGAYPAQHTTCLIIGGGASGLAAAAAFSAHGIPALLLERLDRVGKKILSTGNGRCNLANREMHPDCYGKAEDFVRQMYGVTPPGEALSFLAGLGLLFSEEEGRLYPRTKAAASVLDVLRAPLSRGVVRAETGVRVTKLSFVQNAWHAVSEDGRAFSAPYVLFCPGGSAAPKLGTDGSAAALVRSLGHTFTPAVPALVQLRCRQAALPSLKGLRTNAGIRLQIDHSFAAEEAGELLFTDYGISGIPVLQLSGRAARALCEKRAVSVTLDLLPEVPWKETEAFLLKRLGELSPDDLSQLFTGVFPRMLTRALLRECTLTPEDPPEALTKDALSRLVQAIHAFPLPVTGTMGFEHAQVTSGGIRLSEVSPETMESRLCPGLFFAGEILDVDGPCGGYNLHFAFTSALTAARAIASHMGECRKEMNA